MNNAWRLLSEPTAARLKRLDRCSVLQLTRLAMVLFIGPCSALSSDVFPLIKLIGAINGSLERAYYTYHQHRFSSSSSFVVVVVVVISDSTLTGFLCVPQLVSSHLCPFNNALRRMAKLSFCVRLLLKKK